MNGPVFFGYLTASCRGKRLGRNALGDGAARGYGSTAANEAGACKGGTTANDGIILYGGAAGILRKAGRCADVGADDAASAAGEFLEAAGSTDMGTLAKKDTAKLAMACYADAAFQSAVGAHNAVRADGAVIAHSAVKKLRGVDLATAADACVFKPRIGAENAICSHTGVSAKDGAGTKNGARADGHAGVDIAAFHIPKLHTVVGMALEQRHF